VEISDYAQRAVDLVNADLSSVETLRAALKPRHWLAERAAPSDLHKLRMLQVELGDVVDASARRDEHDVVARLNALLDRHPIRSSISGHDAKSWHLHVSETSAPTAVIVTAEVLFGLALLVVEVGADRLGRCRAVGCGRAFVDTSTNRTRHYCSTRCATRTNVSNFRSRKRAMALPPERG